MSDPHQGFIDRYLPQPTPERGLTSEFSDFGHYLDHGVLQYILGFRRLPAQAQPQGVDRPFEPTVNLLESLVITAFGALNQAVRHVDGKWGNRLHCLLDASGAERVAGKLNGSIIGFHWHWGIP